jgi:hypothetical protein
MRTLAKSFESKYVGFTPSWTGADTRLPKYQIGVIRIGIAGNPGQSCRRHYYVKHVLHPMPRTPATANLPAGTIVPATGIYVVSHRSPAHALPHQVLIQAGVKLPE